MLSGGSPALLSAADTAATEPQTVQLGCGNNCAKEIKIILLVLSSLKTTKVCSNTLYGQGVTTKRIGVNVVHDGARWQNILKTSIWYQ